MPASLISYTAIRGVANTPYPRLVHSCIWQARFYHSLFSTAADVKVAFLMPIILILPLAIWRGTGIGNLRKSACMRMK